MTYLVYSILFILFSIVSTNIISNAKDNIVNYYDNEWIEWKYEQDKKYASVEEELARKKIFIENLIYIEAFNKEEHSFKLAVNQFADLSNSEYEERYLTNLGNNKLETTNDNELLNSVDESASSIDWRSLGAVGAIKDQGTCQCGWAFSAVGCLEGQAAIKTGGFEVLSEQQLLDCSKGFGNNGCYGGTVKNAYRYWRYYREERQSAYPYEGRSGSCRYDANSAIVGPVYNYTFLPQGCCYCLQTALHTIGPISVAMDASQSSFRFYSSGIYSDPRCSKSNFNHAVLVVAYYQPEDYYWVKNSYGGSWGIGGNFKIKPLDNTCGVCQQASYCSL